MIRTLERALTSPGMVRATLGPMRWLLGRGSGGPLPSLASLRSVLVVRLDEIGDVVMTTPLLRELRREAPRAWIGLVVKPAVANLVERCPYVNEVLTFDWAAGPSRRLARALQLSSERLWSRRIELALSPRWDYDGYGAALLMYASGARWRVGYSERMVPPARREVPGLDRLLTRPIETSGRQHEVERALGVLRALGGGAVSDRLELWLGDEDRADAQRLLASRGLDQSPCLVALGPGARVGRRRWPAASFAALAHGLQREHHAEFVVLGDASDAVVAAELEASLGPRALNAAGVTTLRQAAALLERCRLYIGNDTGLMHMAAASSAAVVEISSHPASADRAALQSPARFGPWTPRAAIVQPAAAEPPCVDQCEADDAHCIRRVTVEAVAEAVRRLLASGGGAPA